jgi:DNA-binding response OmpR family regulator
MVHQRNKIVSAGELLEHLYGDDDERDANALEAIVTRVRKKLGAKVIETRKGFGYYIPDISR